MIVQDFMKSVCNNNANGFFLPKNPNYGGDLSKAIEKKPDDLGVIRPFQQRSLGGLQRWRIPTSFRSRPGQFKAEVRSQRARSFMFFYWFWYNSNLGYYVYLSKFLPNKNCTVNHKLDASAFRCDFSPTAGDLLQGWQKRIMFMTQANNLLEENLYELFLFRSLQNQ